VLRDIVCRLVGHRVNRKRAWHDALDYRSRCKRCGCDMIRGSERWRAFTPADERADRLERPSQRESLDEAYWALPLDTPLPPERPARKRATSDD